MCRMESLYSRLSRDMDALSPSNAIYITEGALAHDEMHALACVAEAFSIPHRLKFTGASTSAVEQVSAFP